MLSANQFDRVKKSIDEWKQMQVGDLTLKEIGAMLVMLDQCAQEIDRLRQPAQAAGRGHLKPVILDAQGQAVAPLPLTHQFAAERREQYELDRLDAITINRDTHPAAGIVDRWRVFALRWGLAPPPGGWDSVDQITNVVHAIRLGVVQVPYIDKHFSAVYLTSRNIPLPRPAVLKDGILTGVPLPDDETTGHGDGKGRFA